MKTNNRLGKGLEALLGSDVNSMIDDIENNHTKDQIMNLRLNEISPNPYQPRKVFDETKIKELAQSIKEHGIFTPIIVKKTTSGYNIIAGERRYRASQTINLETIPAIIVDFDEKLMMEIALLENIQREDLNAVEEAQAFQLIMDTYGYTQNELAQKMGKSRSHIANTLRLLSLNPKIQDLILNNKISMGHAKVLIGLDDALIDEIVNQIIENKLSVRQCEKLVNDYRKQNKRPKEVKETNHELNNVEEMLCEKFATLVKINEKKITINYEDVDDLNRILELLNIKYD